VSSSPDAIERVKRLARNRERDPAGVWSAPGRVNLIGEHTDYNDGFVLPFAIAQRTAVALTPRTDRWVKVTSSIKQGPVKRALDDLDPGGLEGWSAYPLGVVWALAEAGIDVGALPGVDILIDSDVPVGAGLSSSAAIECAMAIALRDFWGLDIGLPALARVCQRAENVAVGAPTGIMDQSVSLMGEAGHVLFLDCRSLETRLVPFDLAASGLELLVIDTTVRHSHATGEYASRRSSCETAAQAMDVPALRDATMTDLEEAVSLMDEVDYRRSRHIITENDRVLQTVEVLAQKGPGEIGNLLSASHASMRDDFEISCVELDLAVSAALAAGALGARMTGGGFGGAAIALVEESSARAVSDAVIRAFAGAHFQTPVIFSATPHGGARFEQ